LNVFLDESTDIFIDIFPNILVCFINNSDVFMMKVGSVSVIKEDKIAIFVGKFGILCNDGWKKIPRLLVLVLDKKYLI